MPTTPATPPDRPHRRLSQALGVLHRVLLNAEAAEAGLTGNPYALLAAVMQDPRFAWLRPLSQTMAALDEMGAKGAVPTPAMLEPQVDTVERLLDPPESGAPEFRARLDHWLARRPEVAEPAEALRRVLQEFRAGPGRLAAH
ncbi:hypothetical protein [Roseomonas sp. BN140053]|uniref:hypothetical protein n=1 Tax=Roseomonas sp. BN140053 TaxID=3391898 RepID=UPI0039E93E3C